ncbi:MAG: DUF5702 domain-containing protein [Lachnospiraceae bacterium]
MDYGNKPVKAEKGSITLFFVLLLVPMLSLLLTLLEGARADGLVQKAQTSARMAGESAMAEYSTPLWDEYEVLFHDGSYGTGAFETKKVEEKIKEDTQYNSGEKDGVPGEKGGNYLNLPVKDVLLDTYEFATDQDGQVFRHEAVRAIKDSVPADLVNQIQEKAQEVSKKESSSEKPEKIIDNGEKAKAEAEKNAAESETEQSSEDSSSEPEMSKEEAQQKYDEEVEKEKTEREKIHSMGVLAYYTNGAKISGATFDLSDRLEKRNKNKGNRASAYSSSAFEKVLFQQYIKKKFSCYTNSVNQHDAKYEIEYIIAGKDSDKENLESVTNRLFAVREGFNLVYRFTDATSVEEAELIGNAMAFWIPGLGPQVVADVILAARSVTDSMGDVKDLLAGKRVAIMKGGIPTGGSRQMSSVSTSEATVRASKNVDLKKPGSSVDLKKPGNGVDLKKPDLDESKEDESAQWELGLTYEDYLQIFMYLQKDRLLNYRTMDLIEWSVRKQKGYEKFRMDCMLYKIDGKVRYESGLVFDLFQLPGAPESWKTQGEFHGTYEKTK